MRKNKEWVRHRIYIPDEDDVDELDAKIARVQKALKKQRLKISRNGIHGV